MMNIKKIIFVLCLPIFAAAGLYSQQVIPPAGGDVSGAGGSVSYTIGQVTFNTLSGVTGSAAAGVQQPYEISTITGIDDPAVIILTGTVFPNPAADFLTLRVEGHEQMNLSWHIFDVSGRLLENNKIMAEETIINMIGFSPGFYFLKIADGKKEIRTFKIIKN